MTLPRIWSGTNICIEACSAVFCIVLKTPTKNIRAKARKIAAHLLEVSEEDIEWELGRFYLRSSPDSGVTIQECAMAAYSNLPDGMEPGLENNAYYDPPNLTWPFGCYIATVEVDPLTGVWDVLNFVAVDDCGVRINPMIVEGQVHGGVAQGIGQAVTEHVVHDEDGQLLTATFMDYGMPRADILPMFRFETEPVPSTANPMGMKGCGEAGTVGAMAAMGNAVQDALWDRGVRQADMPFTPLRVWSMLRDASQTAA